VFIVDDPMLALIARFAVDLDHLSVSDQSFLDEQLRSICQHVEQYPPEQRNQRALEWIEDHAKRYRLAWQRRVISDESSQHRCADCPLVRLDASAPCEVHARWSSLLQEYLDDRISSRRYVEDTLALLSEHKSRLRVASRA
jgi:hypothetical protein